jgi:hypothetical protein
VAGAERVKAAAVTLSVNVVEPVIGFAPPVVAFIVRAADEPFCADVVTDNVGLPLVGFGVKVQAAPNAAAEPEQLNVKPGLVNPLATVTVTGIGAVATPWVAVRVAPTARLYAATTVMLFVPEVEAAVRVSPP